MNVEDLVKKYGGKPVDETPPTVDADELARKFGGASVEQKQIDADALAKQFGGTFIDTGRGQPRALTPEEEMMSSGAAAPQPAPKPAAPVAPVEQGPRIFKNRLEALDDAVNLLEEGYDQKKVIEAFKQLGVSWDDIIKHGKERKSEYFAPGVPVSAEQKARAQAVPPAIKAELKPGPEPTATEAVINAFKRGKANLDDLGTNFMFESRLLSPEDAAQLIARSARLRASASPSYDVRKGMEKIGESKTYGDAAAAMFRNPKATFTMLVDSLFQTVPALGLTAVAAPAGALAMGTAAFGSSGATEYASAITDVLQENGVDLMNASKVADALNNPKLIAQMKDRGMKRGLVVGLFDGLTAGLAGSFMAPAKALIATNKLAGTQAKKVTAAAWAKELSMQMAGGAGGEYVGQKFAGQEERPADVLLEALAETGTAPVEAALGAMRGAPAPEVTPPIPPGRIEPKPGAAPGEAPPAGRVEPTVSPEVGGFAEGIESVLAGTPAQPPAAPVAQPPAPPVVEDEELKAMREEFATRQAEIDSGALHPKAAENKRKKNAELADKIAEKEAQLIEAQPPVAPEGATDVLGQVEQGAVGAGVPVPSGPELGGAAAVAAGVEPAGVVSGEEPAGGLAGRETAQPPSVVEPTTRRIEIPEPTAPPSIIPYSQGALDYLNSPSYYGGESLILAEVEKRRAQLEEQGATKSQIDAELKKVREDLRGQLSVKEGALEIPTVPYTPEQGIRFAAAEQAFDDFDSIPYQESVLPELERLAAERNEAEGTDKYVPGRPLEFMTEDELIGLYKDKIGEGKPEEGGEARATQAGNRQEFLQTLDPQEREQYQQLYDQKLRSEIVTDATGRERKRRGLTDEEKAQRRAEAMAEVAAAAQQVQAEQKAVSDVKEQVAQAQQTEEQQAAEAEKQARAVEARGKAPKVQAAISPRVEAAVANGTDATTVLSEIANDKSYNSVTRVIAQGLLNLTRALDLKVSIRFGPIEEGADGRFDPTTNTITLQGTPGDFLARTTGAYTGTRPLDQVVLHELMHYLTDHVIDNTEAYLKSIEDPQKRGEVRAAINRLNNNYRLAKSHQVGKTKAGKKITLADQFNIPTMKEFIAEVYSNPAFQSALGRVRAEQTYKQKGGLFGTIARNIANALGFIRDTDITAIGGSEAGVALKQTLEDIAQIISLPTAEVRAAEVSYAKRQKAAKQVGARAERGIDIGDTAGYELPDRKVVKIVNMIKGLGTAEGWRNIATKYQNESQPIVTWEDFHRMAGKIYDGTDLKRLNSLWTIMTNVSSRAKNKYFEGVKPLHDQLNRQLTDLAKAMGVSVKKATEIMHQVIETLHEPERRYAKYIQTVPLNDTKKVFPGGMTAADVRDKIIEMMDTQQMSKADVLRLRQLLDAIIEAKNADGTPTYLDPYGRSPRAIVKKDGTRAPLPIDRNDVLYNVIGLYTKDKTTAEIIDMRRKQYENLPQKDHIDAVLDTIRALNQVTRDYSREANYWTFQVDNWTNLYNYKYYAPFKGKSKFDTFSEVDERLEFDNARMSKELQRAPYAMEGRETVADNPVLQSIADAITASLRAGRGVELTQAIKNTLKKDAELNPDGQGLIKGRVVKRIEFKDKGNRDALEPYQGESYIYHYNADGSIDVLKIDDPKMVSAIKRTYKSGNPLIDAIGAVTSFIGKGHTRYNYNFPLYNFVRDLFTNAYTMGAQLGPTKIAELPARVAARAIARQSPIKTLRAAWYYEHAEFNKLRELAKTSPYYKDLVELLVEEPGMVSFMQGFGIKSTFQQLMDAADRRGIVSGTWQQLNRVLDMGIMALELASRVESYAIYRDTYYGENLDSGMTPDDAMRGAMRRAAADTKNLANFELIGKDAKVLASMYMYLRQNATGAAVAISSITPAFRSMKNVENELPATIRDDPAARAKFLENYKRKKLNAGLTLAAGIGFGMMMYALSRATAEDDEYGRNKVDTDDMQLWGRNFRFHLPRDMTKDKDIVFQIPWGFGVGFAPATGVQIAATIAGNQSASDMVKNIATQIAFDSLVPVPASRMPIESGQDALEYAFDSVTPSPFRPGFEFLINKNGLGRQVYSESGRQIADAFQGGENTPQIYKRISEEMYFATDGGIDINPNSTYFFANSYADGISKLGALAYDVYDLSQDRQDFDPKYQLPMLGSFLGAKANVDAREFFKAQKAYDEIAKRYKTYEKVRPEERANYLNKYPLDEAMIDFYNDEIQTLNELRQERNEILENRLKLTPKDQKPLLEINRMMQNMHMNRMVEQLKIYGLEY